MAEKKKPGRPPKKKTVTYKDQMYTVLEKTEDKYKLTDGIIHFWVKAKDVRED